jgi:hypothetical protein
MEKEKRVKVVVPDNVSAAGNVLYSGTYWVWVPNEYDGSLITGEDILCDSSIYIENYSRS